jgi:hypothetical protein
MFVKIYFESGALARRVEMVAEQLVPDNVLTLVVYWLLRLLPMLSPPATAYTDTLISWWDSESSLYCFLANHVSQIIR